MTRRICRYSLLRLPITCSLGRHAAVYRFVSCPAPSISHVHRAHAAVSSLAPGVFSLGSQLLVSACVFTGCAQSTDTGWCHVGTVDAFEFTESEFAGLKGCSLTVQ
eukprot:scaffold61413_cov20-Tisochrysis_lutea.AAC.4